MEVSNTKVFFYLLHKLSSMRKGDILRFARICGVDNVSFSSQLQNIPMYLVASVYRLQSSYYLDITTVLYRDQEERRITFGCEEELSDEGRGNIIHELLPTGDKSGLMDVNTTIGCCANSPGLLDTAHSNFCKLLMVMKDYKTANYTKRAIYAILLADHLPMCITIDEFCHIITHAVPEYLYYGGGNTIKRSPSTTEILL